MTFKELNTLAPFKKIFLLFCFILFSYCLYLFFHTETLIIKRDSSFEKDYHLFCSNDEINNGGSTVVLEDSKNIKFTYELSNKIEFPFVMANITSKADDFIDLSHYNYAEVKIKSKNGTRVPFILLTEEPSFTKEKSIDTYLHNRYLMQTNTEWSVVTIPFSDLGTPTWWYTINNISESDVLVQDFGKVKQVTIFSCVNVLQHNKDQIEIEYIKFYLDQKKKGAYLLVTLILLFFVFYVFEKINRSNIEIKKYMDLISSMEQNVVGKEENKVELNEEEQQVMIYFQENFKNEEFSLSEMNKELGISERKITAVIKEQSNLSVKQYLNALRLLEAKKMLRQTSLNISEIAYKIGYSNVSHFNRVFKASEETSPSDFRKKEG